jgi:subtilisin family serine protease
LPKPYTGKGTIVGIFDTGIDFQHPDFSDANGTRILSLWDMSADSATKPPKGFDWGREYTKEEIDSHPENVLHRDHLGHGTHVAAIAAGNGSGKPSYKGIAPEADLIVVNGSRDPFASDFSDADIIAGCNYIFGKAEELGKPCVINLSLGSIIHSHDGEDLLSKALSNLVENKPGRAIVAAAGNEGELDIHTGGQLLSGQRYELLLYPVNICYYEPSFCPDIPNIFLFGADIYTDSQVIDSIYVGIYSIENNEFIDEKGFSSNDVVNNAQIFDKNNQLVGVVSISYEKTGSQHPTKSRYQRFPNDNAMTIGSPAVGKKIISVGSYNTKNQYQDILGGFHDESKFFPLGDISVFSSRGPSRDGRILPILTAPGLYVVSAFSSSTDPNEVDSTMLDPSGMYVVSAGTSMSSPCVAGAVALLFEQTPNLTSDEVIELLKLSAQRDKFTSSEPNNTFGWGKLDVLRLLQLVTDVKEQINSKRISVYPNPATDKVFVTSDEEINEIQIFDVFGNLLLSGNSRIIQVAGLNSGAYFVKIRTKNNDYLTPLIKY